jgi:hypothetical protein
MKQYVASVGGKIPFDPNIIIMQKDEREKKNFRECPEICLKKWAEFTMI